MQFVSTYGVTAFNKIVQKAFFMSFMYSSSVSRPTFGLIGLLSGTYMAVNDDNIYTNSSGKPIRYNPVAEGIKLGLLTATMEITVLYNASHYFLKSFHYINRKYDDATAEVVKIKNIDNSK